MQAIIRKCFVFILKNRTEVLTKKPNFFRFLKKKTKQWMLENQQWRLKKIENPMSLIWLWYNMKKNWICHSYFKSIQPKKYIYIYVQQQKRKNKERSLQIRDYIHKYIHNYIYSCIHNCITSKVVYYSYIYPLQLYITAVIIFNSCNNLPHEIVTLFI